MLPRVADEGEGRLDRELIELLNELRVALPGVQMLFGFLLAVPFSQRFQQITDVQTNVYYAAFIFTTFATIFLTAPTAYHRLRFRQHDKEQLLRRSNWSALWGLVFLAIAIVAAVLLVVDVLFSRTQAWIAAGIVAVFFGYWWFGLPFVKRSRNKQEVPQD